MLNEISRIESKAEIEAYIERIKYALDNDAQINFQIDRRVDNNRAERFTNRFTIGQLFPNEPPATALKAELMKLTAKEYIETVKDLRFPKRSELRVFGRTYSGADNGDVYIKIRVELLDLYGKKMLFVMSFHFAENSFSANDFPYREG